MTTKLNLALGIYLIVCLTSCGGTKEKAPDKFELVAKNLAFKYNAVANWDTINCYTSHFQNMFISKNKLMLFVGKIYDIVKVDSNYVVKVLDEREDATHNFLSSITFSPQQFDSVFTMKSSDRGIFVIKVSKVTSSNPSIKEDEGSYGNEGTYTYTHLSDGKEQMITIFTGTSIECRFE